MAADPFETGELPSEFAGSLGLSACRQLLADQVDMQFQDLRTLLQLPARSIAGGTACNFTAAAMIFSQISGFSVWFFHNREGMRIAKKEGKRPGRLSGQRFKGFVRAYYPRQTGEPTKELIAKRLYEGRNSLVHSLGLDELDPRARRKLLGIAKPDTPMEPADIALLETDPNFPLAGVPVRRKALTTNVSIPGLYWATGRMLRSALTDQPDRCEARAEEFLEVLPLASGTT